MNIKTLNSRSIFTITPEIYIKDEPFDSMDLHDTEACGCIKDLTCEAQQKAKSEESTSVESCRSLHSNTFPSLQRTCRVRSQVSK